MENKLIELSLYERSKLHVAMVNALGCHGDDAASRAKAFWCFALTHLDHVDVAEAYEIADQLLDHIVAAGGTADHFALDIGDAVKTLGSDMTTVEHALSLLGCVSGSDPRNYSTGPSARFVKLGTALSC